MAENSRIFHVLRIFRVFRIFRAFRIFRTYQHIPWILLGGVGGAVLFVIILSQRIPWYALIMLLILGIGGVIGLILQAVKARTTPFPVYQPPEHPAASAEQPSPAPYTQGYQAQPLADNAPGWSPFALASAEPHQDRLGEIYEQPMMGQYPEQP